MSKTFAMSRRRFCGGVAQLSLAAALAPFGARRVGAQTAPRRTLTVGTRVLEVGGRPATVFGLTENGRSGIELARSEGFDVRLVNVGPEPTIIHWHGLTPPFRFDGNTVSQDPIPPGASMDFRFDLARAGTNWMHSHLGLQEQRLLAAPLIVREDAGMDRQEVVLLLHDFTFTPPEEILERLVSGSGGHVGSGTAAAETGMVRARAAMDHAAMGHGMPAPDTGGMASMEHGAMAMGGTGTGAMTMDLNDVAYDAFLANDRTLEDPEVVQVERGGRVRLRVINAATSTNFWLDLGALAGTLVAVDSREVSPIRGSRFELAMSQRLDVEIDLPAAATAFPILAQREGDRPRTGIVLAAAGAQVARLAAEAETAAAPVLLQLERRLATREPLAERPVDRSVTSRLTGGMAGYRWGIDDRTFDERVPIEVAQGERVEITLVNETMMSHPMHLHGHHFQVVGLGNARLAGAMRDTVLVPPMERVTIAFDADNPGDWPLHCHNLYHMAVGMMTTVRYV